MHFCALSQARRPLCPLPRVNDHKRPNLVEEITEKNLALQRLSIRLTVAQRIEPQIVVYLLMVLGLGTPASSSGDTTANGNLAPAPGVIRDAGPQYHQKVNNDLGQWGSILCATVNRIGNRCKKKPGLFLMRDMVIAVVCMSIYSSPLIKCT